MAIRLRVNIAGSGAVAGEFDVGFFNFAFFDTTASTTVPVLQVNAFNAIAELGGAI